MKFYLAAKYDKRAELLPVAALLMLAGHEVTSQWLMGTHKGSSNEEKVEYALTDLNQIADCETFVLFNLPVFEAEQSSGRNVELGYALAKNKAIYIVGDGSCIFYTLADRYFADLSDFIANCTPEGTTLL